MNAIKKIIGYKITVEPVLLFYMFAVFMNVPAVQDLIYIKVNMFLFVILKKKDLIRI